MGRESKSQKSSKPAITPTAEGAVSIPHCTQSRIPLTHGDAVPQPAAHFSAFKNNDLRVLPTIRAGTRYRIKIAQNCCVAQ
jgi:hypothetical protein